MVRVRVFLFILNSPPLNRDVICSRLYFNGKKYEEAISDEGPRMKKINIFEHTTRCVLWKKVFLRISQISQENTCAGFSF